MLDLPLLERIQLQKRPKLQRTIASLLLTPNYRLPPRVRIEMVGLDTIPSAPVIFAMNHTDRYNYWPFQYELARKTGRYTATWVKGKYFENKTVAWFLENTNNLPTISKGYIISRDFLSLVGRAPNKDEYQSLQNLVRATSGEDSAPNYQEDLSAQQPSNPVVPTQVLATPRNILGYDFDPARENYGQAVRSIYGEMMKRFTELHAQAFGNQIDVLIFPQGTRSKRLSKGHNGLAQIALHFGIPIVPVGCSGSDLLYPGANPWAKGGIVTYRFGTPIDTLSYAKRGKIAHFQPFSSVSETQMAPQFQELTDKILEQINELVDDPYRFGEDQKSQGVKDVQRFL